MNDDRNADQHYYKELDRVWVYRLAQVEQKVSKTEENLDRLTLLVEKHIAELPAHYMPREEHERQATHGIQLFIVALTVANVAVTVVNSLH